MDKEEIISHDEYEAMRKKDEELAGDEPVFSITAIGEDQVHDVNEDSEVSITVVGADPTDKEVAITLAPDSVNPDAVNKIRIFLFVAIGALIIFTIRVVAVIKQKKKAN